MGYLLNKLNADKVVFTQLRDSDLNPESLDLGGVLGAVMHKVNCDLESCIQGSQLSICLFRVEDLSLTQKVKQTDYGFMYDSCVIDTNLKFLEEVVFPLIQMDDRLRNYTYNDVSELVSSLHTGECVRLLRNGRALQSSENALELIKSKGKISKEDVCIGRAVEVPIKPVFTNIDSNKTDFYYNDHNFFLEMGVLRETKIVILKSRKSSGCTETYSDVYNDFDLFEANEELLTLLTSKFNINLAEETHPAQSAQCVNSSLDDLIESHTIPVGRRNRKSNRDRGNGTR